MLPCSSIQASWCRASGKEIISVPDWYMYSPAVTYLSSYVVVGDYAYNRFDRIQFIGLRIEIEKLRCGLKRLNDDVDFAISPRTQRRPQLIVSTSFRTSLLPTALSISRGSSAAIIALHPGRSSCCYVVVDVIEASNSNTC